MLTLAILCAGVSTKAYSWPDPNDYRRHLDSMIGGSNNYTNHHKNMMLQFLQNYEKNSEGDALRAAMDCQKWQRRLRWIKIGATGSALFPVCALVLLGFDK